LKYLKLDESMDLIPLVVQAEELSRTGFITALKTAGFDGKAVTERPDLTVPPEINELLGEMTFPAQFGAVRALHRSIRGQGESPWLLVRRSGTLPGEPRAQGNHLGTAYPACSPRLRLRQSGWSAMSAQVLWVVSRALNPAKSHRLEDHHEDGS